MSRNPHRIVWAALVAVAALSLAAGANGPERTVKGYVTDTYCGFNRVNRPPTAQCTVACVKQQHAKYAFFNFADKKVYVLDPQSEAAKFAGRAVAVRGTVSGLVHFKTWAGPSSGAILTASSIAPLANGGKK